jgi:hypothetical protein
LASQITSTCHILIPLHHFGFYILRKPFELYVWMKILLTFLIGYISWVVANIMTGFPLLLEMWQKLRMQIL